MGFDQGSRFDLIADVARLFLQWDGESVIILSIDNWTPLRRKIYSVNDGSKRTGCGYPCSLRSDVLSTLNPRVDEWCTLTSRQSSCYRKDDG
uniref:Uncharacterized protein n=1 Tax=Trichuris muris TaxID=70415 RepID=A0A5S6QJZ0_TRIMR